MGQAGNYKGRHYSTWADEAKQLKRDGRLDEALTLLRGLMDAAEAEANSFRPRGAVAPWYFEQAAIIHRKRGEHAEELAVLDRYLAWPLPAPRLIERAAKIRNQTPWAK